jgi:hypothetical protein
MLSQYDDRVALTPAASKMRSGMALRRRNSESSEGVTLTRESACDRDEMWCDGVWVGPRSLRTFVRLNRFFVGFWAFVLTFISIAFWADAVGLTSWLLILPLAIATAAGGTACFMFGFSRGWIGDGD